MGAKTGEGTRGGGTIQALRFFEKKGRIVHLRGEATESGRGDGLRKQKKKNPEKKKTPPAQLRETKQTKQEPRSLHKTGGRKRKGRPKEEGGDWGGGMKRTSNPLGAGLRHCREEGRGSQKAGKKCGKTRKILLLA